MVQTLQVPLQSGMIQRMSQKPWFDNMGFLLLLNLGTRG